MTFRCLIIRHSILEESRNGIFSNCFFKFLIT